MALLLFSGLMVWRMKRRLPTPGKYACKVVLAVLLAGLIQLQSAACADPQLLCQAQKTPLTEMQPTPLLPPVTLPEDMPVMPHPIRPAVEPPQDSHYTCPPSRYINCMPPLKEPDRKWCNSDYLKWAKENCVGIEVVY
jgi:hypothetical protein